MGWRLAGLAAATLALMAGCAVGAPAPERAGRTATTGAAATPAPAPVTLPPAPSGRPAAGLVGAVGSEPGGISLARLDPATLRPLGGPRVALEANMVGWSVAPDRSLALIGDGNDSGLVQVVDLGAMRSLRTIQVQPGTSTLASAWLGARRVAVAVADPFGPVQVVVLDPISGRMGSRQQLQGDVSGVANLPGGLVLLLTPDNAIGPARLAVVDRSGRARSVILSRLEAGMRPPKVEGPDAVARQRGAGLAVDPAGRRAFVVAPGAPVAEVGLADLRVSYHELDRPASPLARFARWLLPAAEAKAVTGAWRQASWVGGGLLAVASGEQRVRRDAAGELQQRELVSGVRLIDTGRWRAYDLHTGASRVDSEGGRLLLTGGTWESGTTSATPRGVGLTVFGPGDRRPLHLLGHRFVQQATVRGDLGYLWLAGPDHSGYAVVDLRDGRTLHTGDGDPPILLLGDAASW
jgi:hypothetical protein